MKEEVKRNKDKNNCVEDKKIFNEVQRELIESTDKERIRREVEKRRYFKKR